MTTLTTERRTEIARNAARVRWAGRLQPEIVLGTRGRPVKRGRKYQLRCLAEGKCLECGKPKGEEKRTMCAECRRRDKVRRATVERRRVKAAKAEQVKREMSRWSVF